MEKRGEEKRGEERQRGGGSGAMGGVTAALRAGSDGRRGGRSETGHWRRRGRGRGRGLRRARICVHATSPLRCERERDDGQRRKKFLRAAGTHFFLILSHPLPREGLSKIDVITSSNNRRGDSVFERGSKTIFSLGPLFYTLNELLFIIFISLILMINP